MIVFILKWFGNLKKTDRKWIVIHKLLKSVKKFYRYLFHFCRILSMHKIPSILQTNLTRS